MTVTGTDIPGPTGLPVVGSMLDLQRDSLNAFLHARAAHGDVVRFRAGPPGLRTVVHGVFSAAGAQQVLATDAANFRKDNPFYAEIRESFGNGLLTAQDADYRRQRRLVQPLFTRRRVDGYGGAVAAEAELAVARWRALAADGGSGGSGGGAVTDLVADMNRLALRTVTRILFGTDLEEAVDVTDRCFPTISDYVLHRAYTPLKPPRDWPTPANRRAGEAIRQVYAVCDRVIAGRLAAGRTGTGGGAGAGRTGGADTGEGTDTGGGAGGTDDLLDLLARARSDEDRPLDADELRDQVLIFLVAGHETTATSLAFTLHLLAHHPEHQRAARAEIDRVLGERLPTAADMTRLPYLTRCLQEAMRLYPAAPVIGRRAVEACEVDGYVLPAGANVVVSPWVTHRHPDLWDDPERFDPDRFTPEREAARHRYAWFPFGGGPRACIGQHFSMLESVLALSVLLRAYELHPAGDTPYVPVSAGITLQPKGPAPVRLSPTRA
ncbi:cytochrome P450 [Streptomyces sp. Z26]|uniref:cytochrome P450 n=1 Tax=Streptomyces sp. Z26 TaxID=2500177 RepID=UPI000EF1345A|nr:cytochrome P450 [Streptomyces sp. Z26]RLL67362.1 cytochrome P450 [Streptomyces sp. Z26]